MASEYSTTASTGFIQFVVQTVAPEGLVHFRKFQWWASAPWIPRKKQFTKQSSLVYFYLKEMIWESDIPYFLLPCNMQLQFNAIMPEWLRDWMSTILYYSPFMNVGMGRRWPENEWEIDRGKAHVKKQGKHFLDNINIGPFVPWCFSNNITTSLMKCLKDKLSFSCISPAVGCRGGDGVVCCLLCYLQWFREMESYNATLL